MTVERVIVGISGASGAAIAVRIVERLASLPDVETHLVVSDAARRTLDLEHGAGAIDYLRPHVHEHHPSADVGASIASGSFPVRGMIVAPCSMQTLSSIATGRADTLLTRAADVQLKERRRLVLLARETPLHLGHLRSMCAVTEMGAIVMPPVPAFYHRPRTVDEIVDHLAARAIDLLALPCGPIALPWLGQ
ncbi:UbiX family flavin prenyltransferase (plasmid) [Rhizobium sp. TRM96647]|uniref:UbiX family flavin prenyltransferase n=1 Tax=unclassified Rhizobium TaxID=2613769 RepID=UPI0021E90EF1|nr:MULTISPECIES: UbiX family flavin prenyltransferase [unclassified Rhizobium]MCV3735281.1 UbiX family flavin prenyltransferase [Rhizobium sp. TRM96647]MCV3757956.1 UbiX family flavin prenyltransferase [Rhizobium sp. TRM96650]